MGLLTPSQPSKRTASQSIDDPSHDPGSSSSSISDSQPARPPRKLNRSSNQLSRNQACLPCRRRRIKCDAARPHCSSCVRSFRFLARTQPDPVRDAKGVQCSYEENDEIKETNEGNSIESSSATDYQREAVRKLEARISELQNTLAQLSSPPPAISSTVQSWEMLLQDTSSMSWATGIPEGGPDFSLANAGGLPAPTAERLGFGRSDFEIALDDSLQVASVSTEPQINPEMSAPAVADVNSTMFDTANLVDDDAGTVGGEFFNLIWPGWPPRLPTPPMLEHLVQTFFTMVPSIPGIFHQKTFMNRLSLPPTHYDFPHTALLHAICAATARYSAAVHTISVEESMRQTNQQLQGCSRRPAGMTADEEAASKTCFGERHAMFALLEIRSGHTGGRKMLEIAQTWTVLVVYYQQHAKWVDSWQAVGQAVRLAAPLGLLSEPIQGLHMRSSMVPEPNEDWDREERYRLMAYTMTNDFVCSTTSGWPNSLPLDELISELPASREDFERGDNIPKNPQRWDSPDLYRHHPVVDSFVLFVKGVHLLGNIMKFRRKALYLEFPRQAMNTPLYKKLGRDLEEFRSTFPKVLRDPLYVGPGIGKGVDVDLISAHLIPHIAAINLCEPFADLTDPTDQLAMRLLAEARACLNIVNLLTSTTLDFSYVLSPINSFYFFTACRTFILFYQRALETRDMVAAKVLYSEIEVFLLTFAAFGKRIALGARHRGMAESMLKLCHTELGISPTSRSDDLGLQPLDRNTLSNMRAGPFHALPPGFNSRPPIPSDVDSTLLNRYNAIIATGQADPSSDPIQNPELHVHPPVHPFQVQLFHSLRSFRDNMDSIRGYPSPPTSGTSGINYARVADDLSTETSLSTTLLTPEAYGDNGGSEPSSGDKVESGPTDAASLLYSMDSFGSSNYLPSSSLGSFSILPIDSMDGEPSGRRQNS